MRCILRASSLMPWTSTTGFLVAGMIAFWPKFARLEACAQTRPTKQAVERHDDRRFDKSAPFAFRFSRAFPRPKPRRLFPDRIARRDRHHRDPCLVAFPGADND